MKYKKTIIITAVIICAIPLILYLGLLYLFHHPAIIIDLIESSLYRRTGLSVDIEKLTWSTRPLQLVAENIRVTPTKKEHDFEAQIDRFKIVSRISGPFAHRILQIETVQLKDFSVRLTSRSQYGFPDDTRGSPGLLFQVLQWFLRLFLFEKVEVDQIDLSRGDIRMQIGASTVHLGRIAGTTDRLKSLTIKGNVDINGLPAESILQASEWNLNLQLADLDTVSGRIFLPMVSITLYPNVANPTTIPIPPIIKIQGGTLTFIMIVFV